MGGGREREMWRQEASAATVPVRRRQAEREDGARGAPGISEAEPTEGDEGLRSNNNRKNSGRKRREKRQGNKVINRNRRVGGTRAEEGKNWETKFGWRSIGAGR
uniref:Uncharacterized protein n=1 Tax=Nothobranchius furzeri TaxID=105023 RepID=A0A1A7ZI71_NOTFU